MTFRSLRRLMVVVSLSILGVYFTAPTVLSQKPVRQTPFHIDGIAPPATLDELWDKSTVVIDAQVLEIRPANETVYPLPSREPATFTQTEYVVEVRRVLKSDGRVVPEANITVRRAGGFIDRGSFIEERVESDFAKFKPHGRYLLFLESPPDSSVAYYRPAAGADSAFEMLTGKVLPLGAAAASRQALTLNPEQFLALLEQKGGKYDLTSSLP